MVEPNGPGPPCASQRPSLGQTQSLTEETGAKCDRPSPPVKKFSLKLGRGGPRRPRHFRDLNDAVAKPDGATSPLRARSDSRQKQERQLEEIRSGMGKLSLTGGPTFLTREDIEVLGKVGSGVCGEVFKIKHKPTDFIMAAKKMVWLEDAEERKRVLMDLHVMSIHCCPHIVKYYGSVIWSNDVWVFMELMATCLDRLLKRLRGPIPEHIVCKMTVSIVRALHYLKEKHSVIHRDVKPSNMLIDRSGNVKLCDFGISGRLVDSQAFTRNAGCAAYMAPERIKLEDGKQGYDVRADIWSLGISLVELSTGAPPYSGNNFRTEFEMLTHIVGAPPPLPDQSKCSPELYDFVAQCLTKDVGHRPHYPELLQHRLIEMYEDRPVDIAAWFAGVCKTHGIPCSSSS